MEDRLIQVIVGVGIIVYSTEWCVMKDMYLVVLIVLLIVLRFKINLEFNVHFLIHNVLKELVRIIRGQYLIKVIVKIGSKIAQPIYIIQVVP